MRPLLCSAVISILCCGCGSNDKSKGMSLQFMDKVYVLVSEDSAKSDANQVQYLYREADFSGSKGEGIVLYTEIKSIPVGSYYMPVRVRQFFEKAVTDQHMQGAIPNLKTLDPLPFSIEFRSSN